MKRVKFALIALVLIMSAGAAVAFTTNQATKPVLNQHWQFNGTTVAQESDPANYSLITGSDPGCLGTALNCVIDAPADPLNPSQPDLSQMTVISTRD